MRGKTIQYKDVRMNTFIKACFLALTLIALQAWAGAKSTTKSDDHAQIRAHLSKSFPTLVVDSITPSPLPGLFQVMAGGSVIYISADGRYAVSGDIIDLNNQQENITDGVRKEARLSGLKTISENQMIIYPAKDPKYTINVFTDVDCGYCRKMQAEIGKINDLGITVRYLPFPRSGPQSTTAEKMVKIWCAKDKKIAMTMASQDQSFDGKSCTDHEILKAFQYGLMIGVNGTPSILFEDGTLVPGYLPPEKIKEVAEQIRTQVKTA